MSLPEHNKKKCIFCDTDLSLKGNKAKEHVLSSNLQKKIGIYDKLSIGNKFHSRTGILEQTQIPFRSMVGGQVCNNCNNGWMNDLDHAVERFLLMARDGTLRADQLDHADRFLLTRYLLKTAVADLTVDNIERRNISREFTTSIRHKSYLPKGLLTFVYFAPVKSLTVALDRFDYWTAPQADLQYYKSFERLKFGIQINQFSFGLAYSAAPSPCFSLNPDFYDVLLQNDARIAYIESKPHNFSLESGYSGFNVSKALANIGVFRPESIGLPIKLLH